MSLLIFTHRRHEIINRKSQLNLQLMEMKRKLMDLQSYAAKIADGTVSMDDMMTAPASMFNKMSIFMMYSHQQAMMGAQQKFAVMSQVPGAMPQMPNPQLQAQYQQMMFKNYYDQEREKFAQVEQKQLNVEDTKLQQEIARVETQLKMLDEEEKSCKEAEGEGAKNAIAKYTA